MSNILSDSYKTEPDNSFLSVCLTWIECVNRELSFAYTTHCLMLTTPYTCVQGCRYHDCVHQQTKPYLILHTKTYSRLDGLKMVWKTLHFVWMMYWVVHWLYGVVTLDSVVQLYTECPEIETSLAENGSHLNYMGQQLMCKPHKFWSLGLSPITCLAISFSQFSSQQVSIILSWCTLDVDKGPEWNLLWFAHPLH